LVSPLDLKPLLDSQNIQVEKEDTNVTEHTWTGSSDTLGANASPSFLQSASPRLGSPRFSNPASDPGPSTNTGTDTDTGTGTADTDTDTGQAEARTGIGTSTSSMGYKKEGREKAKDTAILVGEYEDEVQQGGISTIFKRDIMTNDKMPIRQRLLLVKL
jgi:hypothetical protein